MQPASDRPSPRIRVVDKRKRIPRRAGKGLGETSAIIICAVSRLGRGGRGVGGGKRILQPVFQREVGKAAFAFARAAIIEADDAKALEDAGCDLTVANANNDPAKQNSDIENFVSQGVTGLIVVAQSFGGFTAPLARPPCGSPRGRGGTCLI